MKPTQVVTQKRKCEESDRKKGKVFCIEHLPASFEEDFIRESLQKGLQVQIEEIKTELTLENYKKL